MMFAAFLMLMAQADLPGAETMPETMPATDMPAEEICAVPIAEEVAPVAIVLEPFGMVPAAGASSITLRGGEQAREFELTLVPEAVNSQFNLVFEARSDQAVVTRTQENAFMVRPGEDPEFALSLVAYVDAIEPPSPGNRVLNYRIDLRDALSNVTCLGRASLPVSISVPARAQVNIAGADGPYTDGPDLYTIAFGSLEAGMERTVFVQLRANGEALLELESENRGAMVSERGDGVPYSATLEGRLLDLAAPVSVSLPPAASMRGRSLPLAIQIGETATLPAGYYEDQVTITISSL